MAESATQPISPGTSLGVTTCALCSAQDYYYAFWSVGKEVLRINGLDPKQDGSYVRPIKPDEIKVIIHTADGKTWKAKWIPVD